MRKVSRSEDNINNNIKEVMTKESADAGQIAQGIATGLAVAVPASIAGGAAINKVVDKIIKKKNAPPATGSEEAYNATGFMSPQQVQERREASFEERYATDDEKGHYKYIHKKDGKWVVVQKGTGKVLSTHDSEDDAIASFKAMMVHKHGSVVEAGAWPSETDWEGHLHNLEELLAETQKGVGWHAAKDEKKEMKAHDKLAKDLQKVIDDIKKVMKFPAAKTASVETEDWRDEHSNLDSDW